jgi:tRNA modification GTPase
MFSPDDTIVAIATPPGRGGLGVVRISGRLAADIAGQILDCRALIARRATFATLRARDDRSSVRDEIVATFFPGPRSYTGEDVIELSAHGSPVVLDAIVRGAIDAGARLARPGEFTFRAFLNGRIDLAQAEAVADLIDAATPLQARVAFDQLEGSLTSCIGRLDAQLLDVIARLEASLDFPEEGYHFVEPGDAGAQIATVIAQIDRVLTGARRGRIIREGATVVIVGRPNVGKSSLFNALAGQPRAIVTDVPGTTRDLVSETVDMNGLAVRLVDTAGVRTTVDIVEREGVARSVGARAVADVLIVVLDQSEPLTPDDRQLLDDTESRRRVIVANKCDRGAAFDTSEMFRVSATADVGLQELRAALVRELTGDEALHDSAIVSNVRHAQLLERAREHLTRAHGALIDGDVPEEFVLSDLHAARSSFDEVFGIRASDEVLRHIFDRFCIGK